MPNDLQPPNSETGNLNKDDIIDILNDDDDKQIDTDKSDDKDTIIPPAVRDGDRDKEEESEEGEEEDKEIKLEGDDDDEEKEIDEEELEVVVPVKRKEILAKYPQLFKDFPYLERAYFREQQFTEMFPSMRDAKETIEKANVLDKFEQDVLQGNTEKVLLAIKENDERSFKKAVDNYLPTLAKVDNQAYLYVVSNIVKHALTHATNEGKKRGESGEPLTIAARILSQHMFGTEDVTPAGPLVKEDEGVNKEKEKIQKEREEFVREKFETARSELSTRVQNSLKATINANIDPKNSMSEYVRRNASRDAYDSLEQQMQGDARFKTIMNTLWRRAFDEGFSRPSIERIKSAYLSKAKTILPSVIKNSRTEALKSGSSSKNTENKEKDKSIQLGKTATPNPRGKSTLGNAKEIPKGMKTLDYLNTD